MMAVRVGISTEISTVMTVRVGISTEISTVMAVRVGDFYSDGRQGGNQY